MANTKLIKAKKEQYNEFYTQYNDIQTEINAYIDFNPNVFKDKTILLPCDDPEWSNFTKFFAQNFERFKLKKLISTSFAMESKTDKYLYQPTLFETSQPYYDESKTRIKGKIFTLDHDKNKNGRIDLEDLEWKYLKGDGDFRSKEIKKLRDKADIIITNPPFSLFREFFAWIMEANKKFLVIANKNCITYKEVFPFIKENKIWSGKTKWSGGLWFETKSTNPKDIDKIVNGTNMKNTPSIWLTNLEHGKRYEPLKLMTMEENKKFSKHKQIRNIGYQKYDNYNAIEVPFTDAIPNDYDGIMGVPISFLEKYCPEQFEILGDTRYHDNQSFADDINIINGKGLFRRILIRRKK